MRTTFVMDPPPTVEDWLRERRALGQDRYDEVWRGEYHVAPGPSSGHAIVNDELGRILHSRATEAGLVGATDCSIGGPTDYRVPDRAYFRDREDRTWSPTAAMVAEIVSPGDESRAKLGFYFGVGVEEVLFVDPGSRTVEWLVRGPDAFRTADGSALLGLTSAELAGVIDWPA